MASPPALPRREGAGRRWREYVNWLSLICLRGYYYLKRLPLGGLGGFFSLSIIAINEIPRSLLNLVEHPSEIFTSYAQTDKLYASKEEDCHHYRRVARYWLSEEICHHDDVDEIEECNQRHEYSQEANDSQRSRGICHYAVECEVEKCGELPFRLAFLTLKLLVCYALLPKAYP